MIHETKVLLDQAIPLQRAGHWTQAIDLCREAFRRSVAVRDPESLNEAVLRTGLCYRQMGDKELAIEYLQLAQMLGELRDDRSRVGRGLNALATVYHMHGEYQEALLLYKQAQVAARAIGDLRIAANIEQNLGALANIQGDHAAAFEYYDSALAAYREIGNDLGIAGVLNNLGIIHIGLSRLHEARQYLDEALSICKSIGDVNTEALVHINRTELFVSLRELASARTACDEAYELVSRLGEHGSRSDALRSYGIIYRETNKPYLAETHLREAIEVAVAHQYPFQEAEAQRELALVLRSQNRNREALEALNRAHELFESLEARHHQVDIAERLVTLQEDFLSLVRAWGESIEAKDRYTRGHCQRVADYACRIAGQAGVPEREITWFRMGALLHDVGKTEIPGEILNKPGRLTDEEREIIERHTIAGDEILSSIPFPWDIRPMVRSHHERWDGRGYPDQLAGRDIPLTARILRIADVFDALTTNRSYRQPLTPEQALQIMQDDHGSFDPDLFEIFRTLLGTFSAMVPMDERRLPAVSESN